MSDPELSQHPVDRLIRELIRTGRAATPEEIAQIAAAPFNPAAVRVRPVHRHFRHLGRSLSARELSLTYHLALRVVADRQWPRGTTASEYLADLRRSVRLDSAAWLCTNAAAGTLRLL